MVALLSLWVGLARAGDHALYERALSLVDDLYLYPAVIQPSRMFADAGRQAAARIEWLLVRPTDGILYLTDGEGRWSAEVDLRSDGDLPDALSRLEDAIRGANLPIDPDVDLRVELLRGAVKSLDRHTTILHAEGLERFDERLTGTLSGVGVTIGVSNSQLLVKAVLADSPAARGGLIVGDVVVGIDGVSTVGMEMSDASQRIRGPVGSTLVLSVRRGSAVVDLTLVRDQVKIRNVTASLAPNGVGVVHIDHFSELTHEYLQASLAELDAQGILDAGVVVDLRGNTGGSLIQSADAADTFLDDGLIVTTAGRDGGPVAGLISRLDAQPGSVARTAPLVVLMDHDTASGSEILAGALAKLDRAILVGTNSFGKGTVQKVYQIDPDIKLKLTVAEYLLRGRDHVANVGLQPDIALSVVHFGPDGVWWAEPGRERMRLSPLAPLVYVADEEVGWRLTGMAPRPRDAALDLASALVAAAEDSGRPGLLDTATLVAGHLATAEDLRLMETFGARGIDWSHRPTGEALSAPRVRANLSMHEPAVAGEPAELIVSVRNDGPTLHRAAIRLRSMNGAWDDRVLPLGRVGAGQTATGRSRVHLPKGLPSRADLVEVYLEAEDVPLTSVTTTVLTVQGAPAPPLAAVARARTDGEILTLALTFENHGNVAVQGLMARFAFPDLAGVELLDGLSAPLSVDPRGEAETALRLRVRPPYRAATLPLDLVVTGEGYGDLARWHVDVPRVDGTVRLEPPVVWVRGPGLVLAPGIATLDVRATDDRALEHLMIVGGPVSMDRTRYEPQPAWNPDKLAWRRGGARKIDLPLTVEVAPGPNRFDVIAEDQAGLRTVQSVFLLGDPGAVAAAADGVEE